MVDCKCPTGHPLFLYVGKAVKLRNRLQVHAFGSRANLPSPWIEEFQDNPHSHFVYVCAWYVPKNDLATAEATLIDLLKPIRNKRDFNCTPSTPWTFRMPDVVDIEMETIIPDLKHKRYVARNSPVRHEPAVYAWYVDPGLELLAGEVLLRPMFKRPFSRENISVRKLIAERVWNLRRQVFIPTTTPTPIITFNSDRPLEILSKGPVAMEGLKADE